MDAIKYKILIADDEYWTREKLRSMISWEKYGLQFLEPAVDGEDVLQKIEQEQPDILLTDINMPFLSGVELLNIIKERYPQMVTFVVSGYSDFAYVKDSFMAGSIDYLVKPVTKIDLINTLSKALEIISSRQNEQEERKKQSQEILKASSLLQDSEFSQLIQREDTAFTPTITSNSDLDFAGFTLMLIKIHNPNGLAEQYHYDMNLLSYNVKKELKRIMDQDGLIVFNHIYRSNEFIIITEMEDTALKQKADKISVYITHMAESAVTVCISGRSYSMESIHMAYVEAVSLFMTRSYNTHSEILLPSKTMARKATEIAGRISEEQEIQLKGLLRNHNKKAVQKMMLKTIGLQRCQDENWGYLEVKQTVKKVLNILTDYAGEYLSTKELVDLDSMTDQADKVIESLDGQRLCDIMEDIIALAIPEKKEPDRGSIREVVKKAAHYVAEHYYEEISLASLSQRYNVESSYFSKLFRQEMGATLMVYIAGIRIEKAKEFMTDQDINLTEIAFMVGYDDYTYFSRVFRKVVGQSPRDYRVSL